MIRPGIAALLLVTGLIDWSSTSPQSTFLTPRPAPDRRLISLNNAHSLELQLIHRIGPVLATRLIQARPYRRWSDVDLVPGVGPVMLSAMQECSLLD